MKYNRMLIEEESPEQFGYDRIKYNLTESSTTDKTIKDVGIQIDDDLVLCYGDHYGKPELRELIAKRYNASLDDVIITVGACMALFITYSALLAENDHILIMKPNYPANIEIPRTLGCDVDLYELEISKGFQMDVDSLISRIKPSTKMVSITYPHNPTGAMINGEDLKKLALACEENKTYLVVDETYGDLTRGERLPHVTDFTDYGICIESLSKAIGVPGIRTGWIVNKDPKRQEMLISAKEQICICGSVVDEECAYQVLKRNDELMTPIKKDVEEKFDIVCAMLDQQDVLEWVRPRGGVVCFPRIKDEVELDTQEFYDVLNNNYGVFVGPGRWFGMDDRYFRLGYAWPEKEELKEGIKGILRAVRDVRKKP